MVTPHDKPVLSTAYTAYFAAEAQQKADIVKVEKSKFFPELSVGYSLQKITPLSGLSSWSVGVAFPFVFLPQKSRVKQAKIDAMTASWQAEDNRIQMQNKIEELSAMKERQAKTLRYYTDAALKEADELQRNAIILYENSETGMAELVQSLNTSRQIRTQYIEALKDYNITAIELELYTD